MKIMKSCIKCKLEKPLNKEHFIARKSSKDGFRGECKDCSKLYRKKYNDKNRESIAEYKRRWNEENKDRVFKQRKLYRRKNATVIAERDRTYYQKNRERIIEKSIQYYEENSELILERSKPYKRRYRKENKIKMVEQRQRRKALKRNLPASLTKKQWKIIQHKFNHSCAYCGTKSQKLTMEHFVPLSRNGEFTSKNIIPACGSCNSSKGDKDFFEWYPTYKHYDSKKEQFILEFLNYTKRKEQQLTLL